MAPPTVSPTVSAELRAALEQVLRDGAVRRAAAAPTSAASAVDDLKVSALVDGTAAFAWSYRNPGDYNLDSLVNVSDLTPLGQHYLKNSDAPDWAAARVADGNGDGFVTIHDVAPIGQNFLGKVDGYVLQRSAGGGVSSQWEDVWTVAFAEGEVLPQAARVRFTLSLANPHDGWCYRVVPHHGLELGVPGNVVRFSLGAAAGPQNLTASQGTRVLEVSLAWEGLAGSVGYEVERGPAEAGPYAKLGDASGGSAGYVDGTVAMGVEYWYRVRAVLPHLFSPYSNTAPGWAMNLPEVPAELSASDGLYADRVELSWCPAGGAAGYLVYRDSQAAPLAQLGNQVAWSDMALVDSQQHTYWLKALNAAGASDFSRSDVGCLKYEGGTQGRGDWWMEGREPSHQRRSIYLGPAQPRELWTFSAAQPVASPVQGADGTLYFGDAEGVVYAVYPDGKLRWTCDVGQVIVGSPAVGADGMIYIGDGYRYIDNGMFHALSPEGSIQWSGVPGRCWSSPAIGPDGTVYVGNIHNKVHALNPDGTAKWTFEIPGLALAGFGSSPAIAADGAIYAGNWESRLYAFAADGTVEWFYQTGMFIEGDPAIGLDGTVHVGSDDGYFYAIRPGGSLRWRYPTGGDTNASPAIAADGTIYAGGGAGLLYAFKPGGSIRWTFPAQGGIRTAPAIDAAGTLYFATSLEGGGGMVYSLSPAGEKNWAWALAAPPNGSPAIGEGGVVYFPVGNQLVAIGAD